MLASPAHAGWTRIDTEHFVIFVDGADEKDARDYGWRLEVFHAAALQVLGVPDSDARNGHRFEVILVPNAGQLSRVKPNLPARTVGIYLQCRDGAIALASRKAQGGRASVTEEVPNLLTAARNARGPEPTVTEYAALEALVDLEADDSARAIEALRPIASNPHDPKLSIRVRSAIQAIQAGQGVKDVAAILNSRD